MGQRPLPPHMPITNILLNVLVWLTLICFKISLQKTIDEQCLYTDGVLRAYKGPGMGLLTMPIAKGTYDNVEVSVLTFPFKK